MLNLGTVAAGAGRRDDARALFLEALALARELGADSSIAILLGNLALDARTTGEPTRALPLLDEATAIATTLEDAQLIAWLTQTRAGALIETGDVVGGGALLREAIDRFEQLGIPQGIAECFEELAGVVEPEAGARLIGVADRLREDIGAARKADEIRAHAGSVERLASALGRDAYDAAYAAGRALDLAAAIALARATE